MPLPEKAGLRPPGTILLALLAAAAGLLVLHARLYGPWINDDAGISFTYARNLAEGNGLSLNPGGERVEGYSNPLWVFLLALFMKAGLFDVVWTPKILALALTAATFYLLARISARLFGWSSSPIHALPALILACSVPFVSWAVSGLENALFLFLLAAGLHLHLGETEGAGRFPWSALVFVLLALTRPEGILYGGAALLHRAIVAVTRRGHLVSTAGWVAIFSVCFAAYQLWHYDYFAAPFPNTYYAKLERGTDLSFRLQKELYDFESTGWKYVRGAFADYRLGYVLAPGLILSLIRFPRRSPAILLIALVAALNVFYAIYVGGDWMDQYRFLGPLLLAVALLAAGGTLAVRLERDPALHDPSSGGTRAEGRTPTQPGTGTGEEPAHRRFAVRQRAIPMTAQRQSRRLASNALMAGASLAAGGLLVAPNLWILEAAQPAPSVSFAAVAERGRAFGDLARDLLVEDASLMDPDLGGTSWASGLRMVDLGGLADAHIARYRFDPRFFLPYVLEEQRPTFVRTHCVWSRDTRINEYAAFREAYLPLWERACTLECCLDRLDGEYIRRDVFVVPPGSDLPGTRRHDFGGLQLAAWELDRALASPGDTLRVKTWWTLRDPLTEELRYTVAFRGDGGEILSEEREFARGVYPPRLWRPRETVREVFPLRIPDGAPRGRYRLYLAVQGGSHPGEAPIAEIEVDARRAQEEAEELFLQAQRAAAGGEHETALGYLDRALALRSHALSYEIAREQTLADLSARAASRARVLMQEGKDEEAADLLLSEQRRSGRAGDLAGVLSELSARFHRRALQHRAKPDSFLYWREALHAFRRALACDPSDSSALMAIEALRGREFVDRTWGEALRTAHASPGGQAPVSALLELIQDEGFFEESAEVLSGSPVIRGKLESEGTLGSLALLHQAAVGSGDEATRAASLQKILALAPPRANLGDHLLLLGSEIEQAKDGVTRISWWFQVTDPMRIDYRLFLHGYVKDRSILPEDRRQFEFANFDHDVIPATSRWMPGSIVRHTWSGRIPPGEYRFLFGFYNSKKNASLKVAGQKTAAVEMGWTTIPGSPGS